MNIAIFSPNKNLYSETFIQAQKDRLDGRVYYYYGSGDSFRIEGEEKNIVRFTLLQKIRKRFLKESTSLLRAESIMHSLKKNKIDVVLVQYGNHAFHILSALNLSNLPLVVHFHGYDASVREVISSSN